MAARLLAAASAFLAAMTINLAWKVGVERDRGAELAAARAPPSFAASPATPRTPNETSATDEPARTDADGDPKAPGLLDRVGAALGGDERRRPPRSLQEQLSKQDFRRMYEDAATREQLIEEQIPGYRDQYVVLERRLRLPSDQWQRFLHTIAEQAVERRGTFEVCGKDAECVKRRATPETYARYQQQVRDVLGDADAKQYETFSYSVTERQSIEALQARLPQSQRLSEQAAEDLIAELSDVRRDVEKGFAGEAGSFSILRGDSFVVVYPNSLKTSEERIDYASKHFKELRERAGKQLNPAQLSVYDELQAQALRSMRRTMAAQPARGR